MTPPTRYHLPDYAGWMRSWNASTATIDARLDLGRRFAELHPDPSMVTSKDVSTYLADPTYGAWSRSTYFNHLHSLFAWLADVDLIDVDPTAKMRRPATPKSRPRPLTVVEARSAQLAASGDTRAALLLGMYAGLRAHEAAKMHSDHVTERELYVVGKGGREHTLPTHPLIWQVAQERGAGFWFPGLGRETVMSRTVSGWATALFDQLGIDGSFHRCRHFYGTSLLRAGVNIRIVQELMRHASLATTASYLQVEDDEKRAAVLSLAA